MSNKDIAEMISLAIAIMLVFSSSALLCLFYKLNKIYDELKEIRKEERKEERKETDE